MKKGILYILLFTYSTMMFKPLLPYITDVVAHTLFYQSHMATVHFENGKFHVHKEIINETKKEQQAGNTQQLKKDNQPNDHINITFAIVPLPGQFPQKYVMRYSIPCPQAWFPVYTPPPRFQA